MTYSVLNLARAGDNIISVSQLYGGTYNLFAHTLPQYGIEVRWADADDPGAVAGLADENTKLVFGETIGNPRLNVLDIPAWAEAAHAAGVPLILDNTVPTPIGTRAFELGADIVVHSLTKFIGGHGTSIGGAVVDSGKFDWVAHKDRFPGLTEPDPSYHGVVWSDALGPGRLHRPRAHRAAAQHRRRAVAVQRVPVPAGHRDAAAADGAPQRQRARRRAATSRRATTSTGSTTRASTRARTRRSPTASSTAATARSSRSGSRAAPRPASASSSR